MTLQTSPNPIPEDPEPARVQDILRLRHACIAAFRVLSDEGLSEHRRIELAVDHLRAVQ